MTPKELREKRDKALKDAIAISDKAKAESRRLTDEERSKIVSLEKEADGYLTDIQDAERDERMRGATATPVTTSVQAGVGKDEEKNIRKLDFRKFVSEAGGGANALTGVEKELHQEAVKEAREAGVPALRGAGIPRSALDVLVETRDMTKGTATAGGNTVALDKVGFFDGLFNKLVFSQMGAQFLNGLVGDVDYPGMNANASSGWASTENATASESNPTTRVVQLRPKRLTTFVDISNMLLVQNPSIIQAAVIRNLMMSAAVAVEAAAINGSGSSGQPTGILNTTGIGDVAGGTDGLAPTRAHLLSLEEDVDVANALMGQLSYLTNGKVKRKLKTTAVDSGSGLFVWPEREDNLVGYNAYHTNNVPSNLEKGSSGAVCSAILFGNFNNLLIANWGGLDIMVNPYTKAKDALTELILNSFWDIGVIQPESFSAMKDALTT